MAANLQIIIEDDPMGLAHRGARIFATSARESVNRNGRFAVALSGGSTPKRMNEMLGEETSRLKIPWDKVYLFWVDERCVPENDEASNYGAAKRAFLESVPIPEEQIYPMPGEVSPEAGALRYQENIRDFFHLTETGKPIFDAIFLGVGKDGHTASLFPGQKALEERERLVVAVKGGEPNVPRLTLTYPVLNRARHIVFLASGKSKAEILKTILESKEMRLPAQKIQPVNGKLTWLLDQDAASLLPEEMARVVSAG